MRCVICKELSNKSVSIEHVIPESLGNTTLTLDHGIVCDKCNQYFAISFERQALELDFFKEYRFNNRIESKRRKIPTGKILLLEGNIELPITNTRKGHYDISIDKEIYDKVINGNENIFLLTPRTQHPPIGNVYISRLLCKIGYEYLVHRLISTGNNLDELIDDGQFDAIRKYIRHATKHEHSWGYNARIVGEVFPKDGSGFYTFICDLLFTQQNELYFIVLLGEYELAINLGGKSYDGYLEWLLNNENKCILKE